jgi:hypothetical protein
MSSLRVLPVFQLDDRRILRGTETGLGRLRHTRELVTLFVEALLPLWTVPGRRAQGPARQRRRLVHALCLRPGRPRAREPGWVGTLIGDRRGDARGKQAPGSLRLRGSEHGMRGHDQRGHVRTSLIVHGAGDGSLVWKSEHCHCAAPRRMRVRTIASAMAVSKTPLQRGT